MVTLGKYSSFYCRYIDLSDQAFGGNRNAFLAATAFVGWRIMANTLGEENGKHKDLQNCHARRHT